MLWLTLPDMANTDMANICRGCGKNMDLVGRSHLCAPVARVASTPQRQAEVPTADATRSAGKAPKAPRKASERSKKATYQYRDPQERKAYMKAYMAKRRERK